MLVAREIVLKVEDGVSEFRDQIQFKRAELPEIWTKVQQYKDSFAVSGKLYTLLLFPLKFNNQNI